MAVVTINRNQGIFDSNQSDELNKAFYSINKAIDDYKATDLDYKEEVQFVGNNSFRRGNVLCIRERFIASQYATNFTQIATLPKSCSVPYDVWCFAVTEENERLYCHIKDTVISVYGALAKPNVNAFVVVDVVLPS